MCNEQLQLCTRVCPKGGLKQPGQHIAVSAVFAWALRKLWYTKARGCHDTASTHGFVLLRSPVPCTSCTRKTLVSTEAKSTLKFCLFASMRHRRIQGQILQQVHAGRCARC